MGIERVVAEQYSAEALSLKDKYKGRKLIILGGGRGVWQDHWNLMGANVDDQFDYMAVNDVGMFWDRKLEHWFSNHADQLLGWQAVRAFHFEGAKHLHTFNGMNHSQIVSWPIPGSGTSGLNAIYAGLCMGYSEIIICGIPLDDNGHFFAPLHEKTNFSTECQPRIWEMAAREVFEGRVKSMSGLSKEILERF